MVKWSGSAAERCTMIGKNVTRRNKVPREWNCNEKEENMVVRKQQDLLSMEERIPRPV